MASVTASPVIEVMPFVHRHYVTACAECAFLNDDESTLEDGVYYAVHSQSGGYVVLVCDVDEGPIGTL